MQRGNYRGGYRGRGGRGGYRGSRGGSSNTNEDRGAFIEGVWHCDCNPRLPAQRFRVKKEGPNQGKWFYTCQQTEPKRCKMFLWEEQAQPREQAAVLANSRSEPRVSENEAPPPYSEIPSAERDGNRLRDNSAHVSWEQNDSTNTRRRSRPVMEESQTDDEDYGDLTADEEHRLSQTVDRAARTISPPAQTPSRKAHKPNEYATPSRPPPANSLPTPSMTNGKARSSFVDDYLLNGKGPNDTPTSSAYETPHRDASPTPLRFSHAAASDPSPSAITSTSLADEVFAILPSNLVSSTRDPLLAVLRKHELQVQGIAKGRDLSRLALKAKDAKVTELQHRISTLEADLELERGIVQQLRWERDNA